MAAGQVVCDTYVRFITLFTLEEYVINVKFILIFTYANKQMGRGGLCVSYLLNLKRNTMPLGTRTLL